MEGVRGRGTGVGGGETKLAMLLIEAGMLFLFHAAIARPRPLDTVETRDSLCTLLVGVSASEGDWEAGTASPKASPVPSAAVNMPVLACPEFK